MMCFGTEARGTVCARSVPKDENRTERNPLRFRMCMGALCDS